ncbi:SusC/RagA family TonB-linked outer membrane protein [Pedobacter sp. GR22-6]|uniref:SusC/RagA family TonB-linked outer membrane protein n=1 Tax=Pedobacter sp. GR22-6 TaxID=3127957 RepID=UPI00307F57B2
MYKNFTDNFYRPPGAVSKLLLIVKITTFLLFLSIMQLSAASFGQRMTLKSNRISVEKVLWEIRRQTGYDVLVPTAKFKTDRTIQANFNNAPIAEALDAVVAGTDFSFSIQDNSVYIVENFRPFADQIRQLVQYVTISGRVLGAGKLPLVGAGIKVSGTRNAVSTTSEGRFSINARLTDSLVISYVGYTTRTILAREANGQDIELQETAAQMNEVVINTGIYQRKSESFTGSSATFSAAELKTVGNVNVLQSLRTLDPSFVIRQDNILGSNPNRLANVEVRGKTSVIGLNQEFGTDPNQPLFILDGFEATLEMISDLSMDRVESITILKDASATAIYGSKAANGVIVVETKKPMKGKLRLSYNGNFSVDFADLTDYNLMNSEQKLQFEKLSGLYGPLDANQNIVDEARFATYNSRYAEMRRGVNTDWMDEALRLGGTQRHTVFAEGGDEAMRYGAGFTIGNTAGVMKGSNRQTINGNLRLIYRVKNLLFTEYLNVDYLKSNEELVPFSSFSRANPYYRQYNADGELNKILETYLLFVGSSNQYVFSPTFDRLQNNLNATSKLGFRNNFEIEWRVLPELRARGRFSITKSAADAQVFKSPGMSEFFLLDNIRKGSYNQRATKTLDYDSDLSLIYGKLIGEKHMINAVAGVRGSDNELSLNGYAAEGFADDIRRVPSFAYGYSLTQNKPVYSESIRRALSSFFNFSYAYDNKYLLDATYRADGSSVFGAKNKFTNTWSVGLAWNINKEAFFDVDWLSQLRIRSSIGNPGNQNFDAYIATKTYLYNNGQSNPFGLSAIINSFGNPELKWQKTLDKNLGLDFEALDRRLRITVEYFNKNTDPLLVYMSIPSSSGVATLPSNLGKQETKGLTAVVNGTLIKRDDFSWNVNANLRRQRSVYNNIGNSLSGLNSANMGSNARRYYDGGTPTALWAVPSAGIDPATGREIFIKKDGTQTFIYDYADEVKVGDEEPKMEGIIGTSILYKNFSMNLNLRYRTGGQIFLRTLFDKVENISSTAIHFNQDARALSERWQKPGDLAKFKAISLTDQTLISSRFVVNEHTLAGESISFGYNGQPTWLKKFGASALNARLYMNEIFRISNVANERGLDYPFARSVSFSMGLTF